MPTINKKKSRPWHSKEPRVVQGGRWTSNNRFYTSTRRRALRAKKIQADPLCEECLRQGRTTPATVVDHIEPINRGGEALAWDNLQSLCASCHNKKSGRESHSK